MTQLRGARQVQQAATRRAERDRMRRRETELVAAIAEWQQELAARTRTLGRESADVDKLESLTLTNLLALVRGSRTDDLDRERAEQRLAEQAVVTARQALETLGTERRRVATGLTQRAQVDVELESALKAYTRELIAAGAPAGRQVTAITDELVALSATEAEVAQALSAGRAAHAHLTRAAKALSSAHDWSSYDTWLGGGAISSSIKHGRIDTASRHLRAAARALQVFRSELADVEVELPTEVAVSPTVRTLDIWFDNIFSDLRVRDRIIRAERTTARNLAAVTSALHRLAELDDEAQRRRAELARRREHLLGVLPSGG